MKNKVSLVMAMIILQSCATPRYSYYFDHHNYNTGKRHSPFAQEADLLAIDSQSLVASSNLSTITSIETTTSIKPVSASPTRRGTGDRRAIRAQVKNEISAMSVVQKKQTKELVATKTGMDKDLKLAAIFGAVGLVGLIIGGVFNIIGGIALLVGVVFFVRWLIRQ